MPRSHLIQAYFGYANGIRIWLKGRVLKDTKVRTGAADGLLRNLINSFRRFETDEIAHTNLTLHLNGQAIDLQTDREGYFTYEGNYSTATKGWKTYTITKEGKSFEGYFFVGDIRSTLGVISDIDDTILETHVGGKFKLKMLFTTFFGNAFNRESIPEMARLYQGLSNKSEQSVPFFYVSHSPWNLYDLLADFIQVRGFPKGPILLRDFGIRPMGGKAAFKGHKWHSISKIFSFFPSTQFLLFGDTSSGDPAAYIELAQAYPNQVKAILLRKTAAHRKNKASEALIQETRLACPILLLDNASQMQAAIRAF